jgi:hypothetical protein
MNARCSPLKSRACAFPHTPLAIAAAEAAHASLPEVVTGHASRVFVFASLAARHEACTRDADTLYVAATYANMGLSAAYAHSTLRYEIDGADAARTFLQHRGAPSSVVGDVWCAIALHMTPGLPEHMSPLARVLSRRPFARICSPTTSVPTRKRSATRSSPLIRAAPFSRNG